MVKKQTAAIKNVLPSEETWEPAMMCKVTDSRTAHQAVLLSMNCRDNTYYTARSKKNLKSPNSAKNFKGRRGFLIKL